MIKIKRALSNKEKRELGIKGEAFYAEWQNFEIVLVDKEPILIKINDKFFPTLRGNWKTLPKVYVDRGAVPFILKGADVMRPGIVSTDEFNKGDVIVVMYGETPIALGIALFSSKDILVMEKGKVVRVIHVKGDELWSF